MNNLKDEKKEQVIKALVEGSSIRSTERMTGVHRDTIMRLLVNVGAGCEHFLDQTMRNLPCKRVQVDEIWSFVYSKAKNVPAKHQGEFGYGDVWTWTAIDADTKLMPCWHVGGRTGRDAWDFIANLR